MNLTEEQVLALSPDAASTKSGKDLAKPEKWLSLRKTADTSALWGEIKGSGSNPYRTQVDLVQTAFKCSCPSRKFPCKHGLGLLFIFSRNPELFIIEQPPAWVEEWLEKRAAKSQPKEDAIKQKEADPAAQAKRAEAREKKVSGGIEELQLWLQDIVRNGIVSLQEKSHSFWREPAARMVDAQAQGLSAMLKNLGNINYFQDAWPSELLEEITRIYLLTEAYKNIENLPVDLQADVRTLVGWTTNQDELKVQQGIKDTWLVMAKQTEEEERLLVQKNWLLGQTTGKYSLILNFSFGNQPMEIGLLPGTAFESELVFYPGSNPLRALIKENFGTKAFQPNLKMISSLQELQNKKAEMLFQNPWINEIPFFLAEMIAVPMGDKWVLQDKNKQFITIHNEFSQIWRFLAISGGNPVHVFGIYKHKSFLPLGITQDDKYFLLA